VAEQLSDLGAALADRYTIERGIGHGGMATVYLAVEMKHRCQVSLKVMRLEILHHVDREERLVDASREPIDYRPP
jgi:serine/threonine-protein kinase